MPIELPQQSPCEICESLLGHDQRHTLIDTGMHTFITLSPWQFEVGQCLVVTRRHVGTLLELTDDEAREVGINAKRIAHALNAAFNPLGILTFQNNGVYSGQSVPHFHFHVVPRQRGSDWGIGPPQLATFEGAGRAVGYVHDPSTDQQRYERAQVDQHSLLRTAALIRAHLPI